VSLRVLLPQTRRCYEKTPSQVHGQHKRTKALSATTMVLPMMAGFRGLWLVYTSLFRWLLRHVPLEYNLEWR
jgi:hypothetical protein